MRRTAYLAAALLTLSVAACFHATIDTGLAPSNETIDRPWAMSFIYGLVPPPIVATAAKCPRGVSKVVTEHSFLNGLVGFITFEIVTPMHIQVTCASGRGAMGPSVPALRAGGTAALERALEIAAQKSLQSSEPVYVRVTD